jgi:putative transposase
MPWHERSPMDERVQFVADYLRSRWSTSELCRRYGISRKTAYKGIHRYEREGASGLEVRPSRPGSSPQATADRVVQAIIACRKHHPDWGGKKIVAVLRERHPTWTLPAVSTANDILKRHHLVLPRSRRRRLAHPGYVPLVVGAPNAVWSVDFKGQFRTQDRHLCYPLTVCDVYSRFVLACRALAGPTTAATYTAFRAIFQEYGLPEMIRSDNGEPFAAPSLARLSRLSVWWIRLGIRPVLIAPASPYQNGTHERMHRTLKAATTRPPARTRSAQQRRFTVFRREYNDVRPHEALGQQPPRRRYVPSPRPFPRELPPLTYPGHYEIRRITAPGVMWWHSRSIVVSSVLIGEDIGLEPLDDGEWDLHFGPMRLGRFDERHWRIVPAAARVR